jgi:hypothetical protein
MTRFLKTVLLTWLFVAIADLTGAYISQYIRTGHFADKMLYYIAGGGLGLAAAMKGGFWIGLIGLCFHFFIAFVFTLLFFMIFPRLRLQRFNKYLVGIVYALFVNAIMILIVLPLSKLPVRNAPFNLKNFLIGWLVLAIALGIPMAISAYRYYAKTGNKAVQYI